MIDELPRLAFDHDRIIATALARLREQARRGPFGHELLPTRFTLAELECLYEAVLGRPLASAGLRRRLRRLGLVEPTASGAANGRRGAPVIRFVRRRDGELPMAGTGLSSWL